MDNTDLRPEHDRRMYSNYHMLKPATKSFILLLVLGMPFIQGCGIPSLPIKNTYCLGKNLYTSFPNATCNAGDKEISEELYSRYLTEVGGTNPPSITPPNNDETTNPLASESVNETSEIPDFSISTQSNLTSMQSVNRPISQTTSIAPVQVSDTVPPTIIISSFISVNEDSPTISGLVTDNEEVIQVTVDGSVVDLTSSGRFSFTRYVPISGREVTIIAVDDYGNKTKKTVHLTRKTTQTAAIIYEPLDPTNFSARNNPNAVALIIGIADYKRTTEAKYADRDAEYFADFARRKLGVPRSNIKVLTNENADLSDIIDATNVWLPNVTRSQKSDVYVFFAGHGLGSDDGSDIYLLPYSGIPQVLDQTSIHRTKLFKTIASTQPNSVTIFLDTCYSGTSRTEETLLAQRGVRVTPRDQSIPNGFTVFSAAGMKQTAKMLDEAKHGLFSYYLMKGMEGPADTNRDKKITAGELHEYVLANVSRLQRNQTPEMQGDADRVLVKW